MAVSRGESNSKQNSQNTVRKSEVTVARKSIVQYFRGDWALAYMEEEV